jgi:phosphoribosylformylglycinamidine synthase
MKSPYHASYLAVVESVSKLIAAGADKTDVYLTFQEYFEKPGRDPKRWGKPLSALLGAFRAQKSLGYAAIGGKDSMSGSFEDLDVPPTLVSFAVTTGKTDEVVTGEFKKAGSRVVLLTPEYDENNLPKAESLKALFDKVTSLCRAGKVLSAWTPTYGGVAEGIYKMSLGNGFGFRFEDSVATEDLFRYRYGSFLLEMEDASEGTLIGTVTEDTAYKVAMVRNTTTMTLLRLAEEAAR